jgi:hypothetical protein
MQATFERNISDVLKEHSQIDVAVDQLLKLWKDRGCSLMDTEILFRFLVSIGYQLTLCSQIQFLLDRKFPIPWLFVLELFYQNQLKVEITSKDFLDIFFTAVDEKSLSTIMKFHKYDSIDSRFETLRSDWISKELEDKHLRKKELLSKLLLLKHERMLEEERKLFFSALEEFPTDDDLLSKYNDFQIRYADHIFQKTETKNSSVWVKLFKKESTSREDPFITHLLKLAKKFPQETYWIASSLFISECYQDCIELLETKQKNNEEKWLLLEAYVQAEQYVMALDYARNLEDEYRDHPELLMSCLYTQAIALEKLGKRNEATQILSSILNHNKNFKMAQYLYDQWSKA